MLTMCWLSPTDTAEEAMSYFVDGCVGGPSDQCDSMISLRIMCCSDFCVCVWTRAFMKERTVFKRKKVHLDFREKASVRLANCFCCSVLWFISLQISEIIV